MLKFSHATAVAFPLAAAEQFQFATTEEPDPFED